MNPDLQVFAVLLPTGYLFAAILYAMEFGGPRAPRVVAMRRLAFAMVLAIHAAMFGLLGYGAGSFPRLDTWMAISAVALCTALLFAAISINVENKGIGGVVLGGVFAIQLAASCFAPLQAEAREASLVNMLHVTTSTLASSSVALSGVLGGLYLLMYRQMRLRSFGALFQRLPDLRTLARLTRRSALAGFLLLGVGLNLGIGWAHAEGLDSFSYTDPYVLIILGLWVHFGVVAFSKRIPGVTAWRAAFAAAAGFLALLVAFLLTLTTATFHLHG